MMRRTLFGDVGTGRLLLHAASRISEIRLFFVCCFLPALPADSDCTAAAASGNTTDNLHCQYAISPAVGVVAPKTSENVEQCL